MENASKALIMAGGVLISLIIIALLVFFFNNLSNLQNTKLTSEEVEQAAEFNKQYDVYARNVYGSELLSIANKIIDYNKRESDNKGYQKIELEVIINNDIDSKYFKKGTYTNSGLESKINEIEKKKEDIGNTTIKFSSNTGGNTIVSRKISKLATMRTTDIEALGTPTDNYQDLVTKYNTLKTLITDVKAKVFKYKNFEYDKNTGRITKMIYEYKKGG